MENVGLAKISEAAKFLNLSKAMVNKMLRDGRIPSVRFGKVYRIPWSWLNNAVSANPAATPAPEVAEQQA
jgi:excisionase family DNA binding protein